MNVYWAAKPDLGPKPATLTVVIPVHNRRAPSLNAVRLLAVSGLVSWSIVAVETWMLVR